MPKITPAEFSKIIGEKLGGIAYQFVKESNFEFEEILQKDLDDIVIKISNDIVQLLPDSGRSRKKDWENGWAENENSFHLSKDITTLIPKYFGKFQLVRWGGRLVRTISDNFEYKMLEAIELHEFQKYLSKFEKIIELGCGTGHNMFRARKVNGTAELIGLDWATTSQSILYSLNESGKLFCQGANFDFLSPACDENFENAAVYSIAALEQIGKSHNKLLDFLISKSPKLCLHLEPLIELMDENESVLDRLCADYCRKRNYLSNFLSSLRKLENEGKIEILDVKRNYIGSLYIEGYSLVAWRPTQKGIK